MTAYFRYEIKRNLLPLAVFTAISCLLCAISAMTTRILSYPAGGPQHAVSAALESPAIILGVLCTLVPVLQFSFRMNKRSADLWYSLPIRREKLLLGRIIGTCLLIFVPFTAGYWLQFAILMCRENAFTAVHYLTFYCASLPVGAALTGINCFIFSRANTVWDGLLFLFGWSFLLATPFFMLNNYISGLWKYVSANSLITYAPLYYTARWFDNLICGELVLFPQAAYLYPVCAVTGAGAWVGLFLSARKDKAENAEQISDTRWGYRTLLPLYIFFFSASNPTSYGSLFWILSALILIVGYMLFVVYHRSFRLKAKDILLIFLPFCLGLLFSLFGTEVLEPLTRPLIRSSAAEFLFFL